MENDKYIKQSKANITQFLSQEQYETLCTGFEISGSLKDEIYDLFTLDFKISPTEVVTNALIMARAFVKLGHTLDVMRVSSDITGIESDAILKNMLPFEAAEYVQGALRSVGGEATSCLSNVNRPNEEALKVAAACSIQGDGLVNRDRNLISLGIIKSVFPKPLGLNDIPEMFQFHPSTPLALTATLFYTPAVLYRMLNDTKHHIPELIIRALALGFLLLVGAIRKSNKDCHYKGNTTDLSDPLSTLLEQYAAYRGDPDGSILRADEYANSDVSHWICSSLVGDNGAKSQIDLYAADMRNSARFVCGGLGG